MINPLAARELRTRFHSSRSAWFLSIWIVGSGLLVYLVYSTARFTVRNMCGFGFGGGGGGASLLASSYMGQVIFESLIGLAMTGALLIVPAIAAVSIVGERQRLTLDLLQVSQLGPFRLVTGKLISSLAYVGLLLVAAAPVLTVPVLVGGVQVSDIFRGLAMIALVSVTVASISTWVSARAGSLGGAIAASYLWVFVLVVGTGILALGELRPFDNTEVFPDGGREVVSMWANPYLALTSAVIEPLDPQDGANTFFGGGTPFDPARIFLIARQTGESFGFIEQEIFFDEFGLVEDFAAQDGPELPRPSLWIYSVGMYLAMIGLSLWRATRLVSVPNTPRRLVRKKKPKQKAPADA